MLARVNVREFVWRCMLAQWLRRVGFKIVRYADTVDGMSRQERKVWRTLQRREYAPGITLHEFATVCVDIG